MRPCPKRSCAVFALLASLSLCAAQEAKAQAATGLNFSGVPFSPSLFQQPAPPPLTPQPGGPFTSQIVTMPAPPLARTTLPSAGGPQDSAGAQSVPAPENGPSHAALNDRDLAGVR